MGISGSSTHVLRDYRKFTAWLRVLRVLQVEGFGLVFRGSI